VRKYFRFVRSQDARKCQRQTASVGIDKAPKKRRTDFPQCFFLDSRGHLANAKGVSFRFPQKVAQAAIDRGGKQAEWSRIVG
jgi:hypothetical protein